MVVAWIPMGLAILLLIAGFKAYKPSKESCPNCGKKGTLQRKETNSFTHQEDHILDEDLIGEEDQLLVCSNCQYEIPL